MVHAQFPVTKVAMYVEKWASASIGFICCTNMALQNKLLINCRGKRAAKKDEGLEEVPFCYCTFRKPGKGRHF